MTAIQKLMLSMFLHLRLGVGGIGLRADQRRPGHPIGLLGMFHRLLVWLHRWTGLTLTIFLILVGVTGSILAFKTKIDRLINPEIYAKAHPGAAPLDPATLAERAEAKFPKVRVGFFALEPEQVQMECLARINPETGKPYELNFDQLFLDPYTGDVLAHRGFSDLSEGRIN